MNPKCFRKKRKNLHVHEGPSANKGGGGEVPPKEKEGKTAMNQPKNFSPPPFFSKNPIKKKQKSHEPRAQTQRRCVTSRGALERSEKKRGGCAREKVICRKGKRWGGGREKKGKNGNKKNHQ